MDDDLRYREEIWAWDAQCAAVDERMLTCPRCGSIMLPQFQKYDYMGRIFRMYQWHMWLLLQNINYAKENKTMKLQKQIILDNVDKVKAFVVTVSKYPGDATLVSGRYVVDAKSIMGIFSLALNKPVAFSYEGEMAAELAKEVQVYESQEV